ncbi:hypothetical protein PSA7680_02311 [Pseudoruegeria aquimaris]|uniref:Uncharacterized protein n=1 Tax=Pseudoruegeria aquimaris TaxID=393663 RepID=A0A1Y5SRD8_9RHOB|nr:hypothetical protein [Pseudoruegeria aquimaris]SLN45267.1 hypothetical protein PSA7680_02311 [Pseudoruegeria aquimaris]
MRIGFMAIFVIIMGFTVAAVDFSRRQALAAQQGEAFTVSDYAALVKAQALSRWDAAEAGLQELRAVEETAAQAAPDSGEKGSFFSRFGMGGEPAAVKPEPTVFACSSERGFKSCKADKD